MKKLEELDIIRQTKEKYYDMFMQFERTVEQNWC